MENDMIQEHLKCRIQEHLKFRIFNESIGNYVMSNDGEIETFDIMGITDYLNASDITNYGNLLFLQYTTVHDCDGIEIYDGDTIEYQNTRGTVGLFAGMFVADWGDETEDELAYLLTKDIKVIPHK